MTLGTPRLQIWLEQAFRIKQRFGFESLHSLHPAAFVDREGHLNLPFRTAEDLAKKMAEKEPEPVLLPLQQDEEELLAGGYQPGATRPASDPQGPATRLRRGQAMGRNS